MEQSHAISNHISVSDKLKIKLVIGECRRQSRRSYPSDRNAISNLITRKLRKSPIEFVSAGKETDQRSWPKLYSPDKQSVSDLSCCHISNGCGGGRRSFARKVRFRLNNKGTSAGTLSLHSLQQPRPRAGSLTEKYIQRRRLRFLDTGKGLTSIIILIHIYNFHARKT
ncbi:hypothetical protein J6590_041041 [Homalodisca vitripennis]|nr:hypothetical protein J6590_041041 [Homalodisca vitripennis]